jgi:predicted lipid-binding transport protein (Tim44 family)
MAGVGASLASIGQSQKKEAIQMLGESARQDEAREAQNTIAKAQARQGNQALGSSLGGLAGGAAAGAMYGTAAGPWGTVIGGVLGALAGSLFS